MKIRAGNRRKSSKIKKLARKKGKNSPSEKKGLPKKKKEGGKKGTLKIMPFKKKWALKKKKTKGLALFLKIKKISPSFHIA